MIQRIQRSVVRLDVTRSTDHAGGTAFIVASGGLAITNFHVVRHGVSAEAFLPDGSRCKVELIAAKPEFDLALVKIGDAQALKVLPSLQLADTLPRAGEDVWAIGFPSTGLSVTKGIVSGIRHSNDQSDDIPLKEIFASLDPSAVIIQTDCTLNHGNSGGPLLNAKGQVLGVNTWLAADQHNVFYATAVRHAMVLAGESHPQPLTFAGLAADPKLREAAILGGPIDLSGLPHLSLTSDLKSIDAQQALILFKTQFECPGCHGTGTSTVTSYTDKPDGISGISERVKGHGTVRCTLCNGTGRNSVERINSFGAKAFLKAARVKPDDKNRDSLLSFLKDTTLRTIGTLPKSLRDELNSDSLLGVDRSAALFVGEYVGELKNGDSTLYAVKIEKNRYVLVAECSYVKATVGQTVVTGGGFWGRLGSKRDEQIPVIKYGMIVPAD